MPDRLRLRRHAPEPDPSWLRNDGRRESLFSSPQATPDNTQLAVPEAAASVDRTPTRQVGYRFDQISILPPGSAPPTDVSISPLQRQAHVYIQPMQPEWPRVTLPMERPDARLDLRRTLTPIQRVSADIVEADEYKLIANQSFRTENRLTERDTSKGGQAEGYGAKETGGKDLKTTITWSPADTVSGEGTEVKADVLGPDHPLGSKPDPEFRNIWNQRTTTFNHHFQGDFIAGHLLNAELGGPGNDPRNLTAISSSANSAMRTRVEDTVRDAVNKDHGWIHYSAKVTYSDLRKPIKHPDSKSISFTNFASAITFTWGSIDSDGKPTGDTQTWTMGIPRPSSERSREARNKAVPATVTATGNVAAQAKTAIGPEDLILDDWGKVKTALYTIRLRRPLLNAFRSDLEKKDNEIKNLNQKLESTERERDTFRDNSAELQRQLEASRAETARMQEEARRKEAELVRQFQAMQEQMRLREEQMRLREEQMRQYEEGLRRRQAMLAQMELEIRAQSTVPGEIEEGMDEEQDDLRTTRELLSQASDIRTSAKRRRPSETETTTKRLRLSGSDGDDQGGMSQPVASVTGATLPFG